jgi:hypothetical protein
MSDSDHKQIIAALFLALKPFAKMLLKRGLGYRDFSNVAKSVFIKVASEEFGVRGRPTNISRVAIMNGLSRKEVSKLRVSSPELLIEISSRETPLSLSLHEWVTNPKFLDENGEPRVLSFGGEDCSFSTLVEEIGGDIPPGALRTELKRVGAISELPNKQLKLENRCFIPVDSGDKLELGLTHLYALGSTVEFNGDLNRTRAPRIERHVIIDAFPSDRLQFTEELLAEKLRVVSEDIDDSLTIEAKRGKGPSSNIQVGVGLFYYQIPENEEGS